MVSRCTDTTKRKGGKNRTYILNAIRDHGECYVGWGWTYGTRLRDAARALQDEGLIVITDLRRFKSGRVSAIAKRPPCATHREEVKP